MPKVRDAIRLIEQDGWSLVRITEVIANIGIPTNPEP